MEEAKRVACLAFTPCHTNSPPTPQHHISNILRIDIVTSVGFILNNTALFQAFQTFLYRWHRGDDI